MKFILNTSADPHFCALFDAQNNLIEQKSWTIKRRDGAEVFDFLKKHDIKNLDFSLIGGISGPGGFSSLRVGAGILNAISFAKNIPVSQIRADVWISRFLERRGENPSNFLLNSFSDGVFYCAGETTPFRLQRITIDEAAKKFKNNKMFVGLLPVEKKNKFLKRIDIPFEDSAKILLEVLDEAEPRKMFMPDYEFPAV